MLKLKKNIIFYFIFYQWIYTPHHLLLCREHIQAYRRVYSRLDYIQWLGAS